MYINVYYWRWVCGGGTRPKWEERPSSFVLSIILYIVIYILYIFFILVGFGFGILVVRGEEGGGRTGIRFLENLIISTFFFVLL